MMEYSPVVKRSILQYAPKEYTGETAISDRHVSAVEGTFCKFREFIHSFPVTFHSSTDQSAVYRGNTKQKNLFLKASKRDASRGCLFSAPRHSPTPTTTTKATTERHLHVHLHSYWRESAFSFSTRIHSFDLLLSSKHNWRPTRQDHIL